MTPRGYTGETEWSLVVETEPVYVSTMGHHVPDPKWSKRDSHGHVHRFEGDDLPTLERVVVSTYWCETCQDEHEEIEMRCRECGDVVEPHWDFTGPQNKTIAGRQTITLRVGPRDFLLTPEQAEDVRVNGEAAVERILKSGQVW